jgi:pyruvate kinase
VVKSGDLVAITAGLPLHQAGTTNMITVKVIE